MGSSALEITIGGEEYAEKLAEVIAAAFANDPLNRYIIAHLHSVPNGAVITQKQRVDHFLPGARKKAGAGAQLVEAGNWAGAALWVPPGSHLPALDPATASGPLLEYMNKFGKVKARHLGTREYWYLNLIGRHPERTEPGVARALIAPVLKKAKHENSPAWLEATNDHARDVYAYFGFRVVDEVRIGEGKADHSGNLVEGGEGILVYGMIFEPNA